ncbi:hypothetical protein G9F72_021305 [Clostridium estertheticum]|uniref:hypothetical protein n=1 Tax=Clostridium estertheticum TaxID=238834 RepID=UPI0013E9997E|nr:hypothetical protein [Clostridium estertheticum]MBN4049373.1 hypothetical protein [bacterium AH-315-N14]MBZ9688861.1 hypothetical protein [Clostridium estertheticum]
MDKSTNNYYLETIKNKIKKLDLKKAQYELEIMQQNNFLENNNSAVQKLKCTNDVLHDEYNSLIRLLQKEGIIFEINFSEYIPQPWDNLFIVKGSKGYEIQSKTGIKLMMLNEKFLKIIQDINKKDSYSLIVIRVMDKTALVQLRFT